MQDRILFMLEETWANLRRNGLMQLAAISTATVALILLGSVGMILYKLDAVAQSLPKQFEVNAFMLVSTPRKRTLEIKKELESLPEVLIVRLKTKEEAWPEFQKMQGVTQKEVPYNPLPDCLIVQMKQPDLLPLIAQRLEKMPEIDEVVDHHDDLAQVLSIAQFVRWVGFSMSGALLLAAFVLIYNAIRLTVIARQTEVRIMALQGATHRTIRLPFVLEGATQGGVGGILASGCVLGGARAVSDFISQSNWYPATQLPGAMPPLYVIAALLGCGILMGALCATWAANRFVRV